MNLLNRHPQLTVIGFAVIVVGAVLFGVDRIDRGSDDATAEPAPQGENFQFDLDQLEAALTPLDDLTDRPAIHSTGNLRTTDQSEGIVTNCRDRWHPAEFSFQQRAQRSSARTGSWIGTKRTVYLLADQVVPRDLFAGLAATPIGCDLNPIDEVDHIVSAVTISEFDGFDAVTIVASTNVYNEELSPAKNAERAIVQVQTDHWVRHGNALVLVTTRGETQADVPLLLRDALASLETLKS